MTAPPQGVEVDHVEFPAGKIRYHRAGSGGPAVVLLHGGGVDNGLLSWRHAVPTLAVDHRVYIPDLPGQGGSTGWRGRANQRTLEEVLRWLLDTWGVHEAVLVGLSLGGSVATGFALRHPHRVRGLVLVDAGGLQHRMHHHLAHYLLTRTRFVDSAVAKTLGLHRSLTRSFLTRGVLADTDQVPGMEEVLGEVHAEIRNRKSVFTDWQRDAIGRRAMKVNHLPQLERLRCPTMLVHGERDTVVPVSVAREAAGAIPGSKLRVISGAGHWPNRERPNEFNALLREFVNGKR
ncbi:pimeloyl-ACP methyl ester carboxylesterase [Saccharopolyspora lacisalsi]|uniref:Pimeloyl-ACP methyl ester carboxylesterase n=1 Tax=Halosaccharopolyspora lacisalsi TaxID=1000566 RepID=A0A839DT76_9PSEU|nr:alpha/beta hydrolase [Halosaccharopolyspora lacisalsi]MBA8825182.1 pimeloyl-ACP methyl ester carboxylesterase [Halosaccharopolyspora lacisalsi]